MPDIIIGGERDAPARSDRVQNEPDMIAQAPSTQTAAPVQLAQGAVEIGSVSKLTGQATIIRATGETVPAELGTPVFQDDTFETGADSGVGLTFQDGSSFSLGADARLTVDSFVYDAGGADSNMVMNLAQGAFSFVSGQVAKTGDNNMTIVTPTATIGVRGTAGAGDDDEIVLLQEQGQQLGELTVTTQGGTVSLTTPNSYTNTSNPLAPPTPPIPQSLGDIQSRFGTALRDLPVQLPANQNLPQGNDGGNGAPSNDGDQDAGNEGDPDDVTDEGDTGEEGEGGEGEQGEGEEGPIEGEGPLQGEEGLEGEEGFDTEEGIEGEEGLDGDGAGGEEGPEGEGAEGPSGDGTELGDDGLGDDGLGGEGPDSSDSTQTGATGDGAEGDGPTGDGGGEEGPTDGDIQQTTTATFTTTTTSTAPPPPPPPSTTTTTTTTAPTTTTTTTVTTAPPPPPPDDEPPPPPPEPEPETTSGNTVRDVTLTTAVADAVQFTGSPEVVKVAGQAQAGDTFVDVNGGGQQFIALTDPVAHTFSVQGVENIFFNHTLSSANSHNISIIGTTAVNFDALGGSFDGTITGDTANNTISIKDNSGIDQFLTNLVDPGTTGDTLTGTIDLLGGTDTIDFSGAGSDLAIIIDVANVENYAGSIGDDTLTLQTVLAPGASFDGGGTVNGDTLNLAAGANTASITGFTFVNGAVGLTDTLTLESIITDGTEFDLGPIGDGDTLNLADGAGNVIGVTDIDFLNGGTGDDTVTAFFSAIGTADLGGGFDTLDASTAGNFSITQATNVEAFIGSTGVDTITLGSALVSGSVYDGGTGADSLTLFGGSLNTALIANFEQIFGGGGNESLTFEAPVGGSTLTIDMSAGIDDVTLSSGGNIASFFNTEFITGGDNGDQIFLEDTITTDIDLGLGGDEVVLNQNGGTYNFNIFAGVESLVGVDGGPFEIVTFNDAQNGLEIDLGLFGDGDQVNLANGVANFVRIFDLNNLIGGTGNDSVELGTINAGLITLGGGIDSVDASNVTASTINTLTDVENFLGSTGTDFITLGSLLTAGAAYSGNADGDADVLQLTAGTNTADIAHFESILGSAAADTLNLEGGIDTSFGTTVDLGGGIDDLVLANFSNDLKVLNVEILNGGSSNDTVELLNDLAAGDLYNGLAGTDTLKLLANTFSIGSILDFESVLGTDGGGETLVLENNIATGTLFDLGLATDSDDLTLADGGNTVTVRDLANLTGGIGNDTVTVQGDILTGANYNGGGASGDADELILQDGSVIDATIEDFELISANTTSGIVLNFENINDFFDEINFSGTGVDFVTFAGGTNTIALAGVENIDAGIGTDFVNLLVGGETVNFANVEDILGSSGNDTINIVDNTSASIELGLGDDTATGAAGVTEVYRFTSAADAVADGIGNGAETITNFEVGFDIIDITAFGVGNFFYNGAGAFSGGGTASATFDTPNETLSIDTDGDANADLEIVMNGVTDTSLTSGDFSF